MTLSVLALNKRTQTLGCAAATGNLAVGGWVLRCAWGIGAVATQGISVSPLWGDRAIQLLGDGYNPQEIIEKLCGEDTGREHRQLAVLSADGIAAAWTGARNMDCKGHIIGDGYVVAGNWLRNDAVLSNMSDRCAGNGVSDTDFARQLLAVVKSGIAAGGDARGTLSAAIKTVCEYAPPLDLRIDYSEDPVTALTELLHKATTPPYTDWIASVPTHRNPFST